MENGLVAALMIGAWFGAAAFAAVVHSPVECRGQMLWKKYVTQGKLVEAAAACGAMLGAIFIYLQLAEAQRSSQNQLRAYVLFARGEFAAGNASNLEFKNVGETPALNIRTSCTMDRITDADLDGMRSNEYRGSAVRRQASDRGKDQIVMFRQCDATDAFGSSAAPEYVWAQAKFRDIFGRCQHSWVLLKPENGTLVIEYTGTTAPDDGGACDRKQITPP
jgi:hypothetical protein